MSYQHQFQQDVYNQTVAELKAHSFGGELVHKIADLKAACALLRAGEVSQAYTIAFMPEILWGGNKELVVAAAKDGYSERFIQWNEAYQEKQLAKKKQIEEPITPIP